MRSLRVGILQLESSTSLEDSIRRLKKFSNKIKEADIVIIPEYSMIDPTDLSSEDLLRISESLEEPGAWLTALKWLAKEKEVCVVGTLFRRVDRKSKVRNSVVLIDAQGEIISYYDKTHLFDALGYRESDKFDAGDRLFKPIRFCGVRIGLAICFELRFPEIFRYEALNGAELIVVPAAWYRGPLKESMLDFLAKARAHENVVFVAVAALSGERFTGGSAIVDPLGFNFMSLGPEPTYAEVTIDLERVQKVREILPLLRLRRSDLYKF
jgi:predicted amidohydrolase